MPKIILHALCLAQAAAPASAPAASNPYMTFLPMIFLFAAMYFLMIAPQRKKQKEHEKMLSALRSGDEVVTTGGIFGVITNVKEDRFVIKVSDTTKLEVGKGFISTVVRRDGEEAKQ